MMNLHGSDRGPTRPLASLVAISLSMTLSCTGSSEDDGTGESTDSGVENSQHRSPSQTPSRYTLFESGQVRPLALSPNKRHLFAVNTPDNRLEVYRVHKNQLIPTASIPVGLEPVAVAARTDREVWVVNHLSDSVSIVEAR